MADVPLSPTQPPDVSDELQEKSGIYKESSQKTGRSGSRVKIALIAAASALAGGLAAAWYYRRTVSLLQNHPDEPEDSNFGIISGDSDDD